MKISKPGLLCEPLPSGTARWRVRVEGDKARRITLPVDPAHPEFENHYRAARAGIRLPPPSGPQPIIKGSVAWLVGEHLAALEADHAAGLMATKTLAKRRNHFTKLVKMFGPYDMMIPPAELIKLRDSQRAKPAMADDLMTSVRVMYNWGMERAYCPSNPAAGIKKIDRGKGGAKPWTVEDLRAFRDHHGPDSTAYLCLTLLMFTACRISEAAVLGRSNEFMRNGVRGLGWQPQKKGTPYVEVPMMQPLYEATRRAKLQGQTYLLTDYGQPFASGSSLSARFIKWCQEAGLQNRSAHGIRKAAGHLLAHEGCSQYQIMAVHGHKDARTSEVYTRGVERWRLAQQAMEQMVDINW